MSNDESNEMKFNNGLHVKREEKDIKLWQQLLFSPDQFVTERSSDEALERQYLKGQLIKDREFILGDFVVADAATYQSKFFKEWFYKVADLFGVNRSVMDVYIKPDFVRKFIIQFVYARFPYLVLRSLRGMNRRAKVKGKLFQYLKKDVSDKLDKIIAEVYELMCDPQTQTVSDFKKQYGVYYKMYYEVELF